VVDVTIGVALEREAKTELHLARIPGAEDAPEVGGAKRPVRQIEVRAVEHAPHAVANDTADLAVLICAAAPAVTDKANTMAMSTGRKRQPLTFAL
jgi:hypothetical protein